MSAPDDAEQPPEPLTLVEAEQWLLTLENIATLERDLGAATRLVVFGLFGELARSGVIDGAAFIARLRSVLPQLPAHEVLALNAVIPDLQTQLPAPAPDDSGPNPAIH
jgi:hypothetical protein